MLAEKANLVISPFDQRSRFAQSVDEKPKMRRTERRERIDFAKQLHLRLNEVASRPPKSGLARRGGMEGTRKIEANIEQRFLDNPVVARSRRRTIPIHAGSRPERPSMGLICQDTLGKK